VDDRQAEQVGILCRLSIMRLQDLIPPQHILLGLEAKDKWEVIERLTANLMAQGAVSAAMAGACRDAVIHRERSMSTGMERGIAIPHAAVDGLERVVASLAVVRGPEGEGVPFDSVDAGPAWLVVLLLIPRPQKLLHIRTLADLARHLGSEEVRHALRSAATAAQAWQALARG
jgi:mannitol/fructose-specific phosphotransferase system IIA component (Ntr-type)